MYAPFLLFGVFGLAVGTFCFRWPERAIRLNPPSRALAESSESRREWLVRTTKLSSAVIIGIGVVFLVAGLIMSPD
jgi:hypothetical protein